MTDASETGMAIFKEIYGEGAGNGLASYIDSGAFGSEVARWANDFAFGTVWSRDGLDRKLRSCVVLGMMIALRQREETRYHTKMGTANGLTRTEIEEILNTAVPYCGLPAAQLAKDAMLEAFREMDAAPAAAG